MLNNHPAVKLVQQQQQVADAAIKLEKSRLLPDLSVAYANTSIKGMGADNVLYGTGTRFNAVQVGVGIPIFAKSQKAKISSAIVNKQIAEGNYTAGVQTMQYEYNAALAQYAKYQQTVEYFESTALQNAALVASTANQQLAAGSINYLEWVQLVNQSVTVKSDYADAVKSLNEAAIQVNYFTNQ